eukprot:9744372-Lingulodinium_polyedra.AAC.1
MENLPALWAWRRRLPAKSARSATKYSPFHRPPGTNLYPRNTPASSRGTASDCEIFVDAGR